MSIRSAVNQLNTSSEIDEAYRLLKEQTTFVDRTAAQSFRLNQPVKFRTQKDGIQSGKVKSIGRTGRIVVDLTEDSYYDSFTLGGAYLKENLL